MDYLQTQGLRLPRLGLGTFRMANGACRAAVESAVALGYRHIDTAEMYGNEAAVGEGVAASRVPRGEIHVTTKVWPGNLSPDGIRRALAASLKKLRFDYVDLYLVHWPAQTMDLHKIFETLLELRDQGLVRAIGVCNFTLPLLRAAIEDVGAPIACNQVEYHVLLDQTRLWTYLSRKSIPLVAYAPLAQGSLAHNPELAKIATKHNVSAAQVALKWLLDQDGVAAIPKAQRMESQKANLEALDIVLDDDDRRAIASLPKNKRFVDPPFAPTWDQPDV